MMIGIIFNNFGPYHLARLAAGTEWGRKSGFEVVGIEVATKEILYPWESSNDLEIRKYTLFSDRPVEEISFPEMVGTMWRGLNKINPQVLAISGYKQPQFLAALAWARLKKRVAVLLSASKYDDFPRHPVREWFKRRVLSLYDGVLAGGSQTREYMQSLGVPVARIMIGADVVNNHYFAKEAARVREQAQLFRRQYDLPENYFLSVGRFDEKKNLLRLLSAYRRYCQVAGEHAWSLVLCGSGPLEGELKLKAQQLGLQKVQFPGFIQINELPIYYALARLFIIPSSHSEQWGLVVNEAMASGLPVLVSQACGCAKDLVQDGVDGFTFDPYDEEGMSNLLLRMSSDQVDLKAMGKASLRLIADWPPELFGQNLMHLAKAILAKP